ncbi:hypothetical protein [Bacillus cereus]|uniref:hypothetical protein n=1 Tax=Bacillus cereus TaxID=1396 RepID=UPI0019553E12|nr:hypothetical protein [Bacillus cereus]
MLWSTNPRQISRTIQLLLFEEVYSEGGYTVERKQCYMCFQKLTALAVIMK